MTEPVETEAVEAPAEAPAKGNVFQRLSAAMQMLAYLKKDTKVKGFGSESYTAISHDHVTAECRAVMLKCGLIAFPQNYRVEAQPDQKTKSGSTVTVLRLFADIRFQNIDDPSDFVVVPTVADGKDAGDKAPGKAISMAVKYGLLKALMLETGDREEERIEVEEGPAKDKGAPDEGKPAVNSRKRADAPEPRVRTVPGVGNGDPLFIPVGKKHYANGAAYDDWTGWKKALADAAKAALQMPDAKDALDELFAANEDSVEAFGKAPEGTDGGMRGFISWREGIYARVEQPETEAAE
jgi:hypothetical protein